MDKINIDIKPGDHSKEMRRINGQLLPQEMQDRNQKKLSEYAFQKRCLLRTQIDRLLSKIEAQDLSIEEAMAIIDDIPTERRRQRTGGSQGNLFQYPA